jgi:hypothetical protein
LSMWSSKPWDKAWKECKELEQLLKWKLDCPKPLENVSEIYK